MNLKNFITFEGGECSGKTTVIHSIKALFDELGIEYISTREPGGIKIAEQIRNIILDINNKEMTSETETLLYAAARMQHLSERVIHEFIHAIQIVKDKKNNIQKVGVCEFNEFKATGIGLNEAAVQYITSKITNKEYKYVNKYEVVAKTYNEERYPLMCNLILQLIYITSEDIFLDSILNCKEDFEYKIMENCGEGVYITIVNGLDKMLYAEEENIQLFQLLEKYKQTSNANTDYTVTEQEVYKTMAKIETNRKAIKDTYIKLENLILNSYFNKYFSRIETLDDIITYRKDLYNYKEIYGMNSFDNEYNKYYANKIKELEEKRINIMRKSGQFSLVKTDNKILNIFSKIRATLLKLFKRNIEKEENR